MDFTVDGETLVQNSCEWMSFREHGLQGVQAGDPHGAQYPTQAGVHLPLHIHLLGHTSPLGNTGNKIFRTTISYSKKVWSESVSPFLLV
jgi:hypothetical protein